MIKIIGRDQEYEVNVSNDASVVNGQNVNIDLVESKEGSYHAIVDSKSYNIEVAKADYATKEFEVRVNNQLYKLAAKDQFDALLEELGMDSLASAGAEDLKAPMPGLVLEINATPGQEIKKGDSLLVLEAMKMENVIKAAADATVKSIEVEKGQAVEKNQVLIAFE